MMRSLRSKLIVAFVLVIFLCLLLASSTFVFLLRGYQTRLKLDQLEELAATMSVQARLLERAGAQPDQAALVLQEQAREMGVRVLLLNSQGVVVHDSQGELQGEQVPLPSNAQTTTRNTYSLVYRGGGRESLFLVLSGLRPTSALSERFLSRVPTYSLVLAVPQQSVGSAWLELAPSLSLAALISLVVSVAVAILLSRSISRPISAITRASEEMAKGNYDQSLPVRGGDEIGRMAAAFNRMAAEVKASHRTLRDFLANVSHELKTPLTSIQGFSQALVDGAIKDDEGFAAAGRIINEEAERMRRLVEDLLYLSKIESGQIPMEKLPVDLKALVESCVRKTEMQVKEAEVATAFEIDDLPLIQGDAHKLEQVLTNLLDNALKHTPGGGTITLRGNVVRNGLAAGIGGQRGTVRVAVHNTGSTISGDELEKVFERFYQVDKSRTRSRLGSGLGLAIVREIVQAHGGAVEAQSSPLDGTEFAVYLPVGPYI